MSASVSYRVRLEDDGGRQVEFDCPGGTSIARAALLAGYQMRVGCMQGRCTVCRCHLRDGSVRAVRKASRHAVDDPANREDGYVLPCSITVDSDTVLRVRLPWQSVPPSADTTTGS